MSSERALLQNDVFMHTLGVFCVPERE